MHNKFLGTGEKGYHPLRKIRVCLSGLRYAVRYDFSVTYKLVLSLLVLAASFCLRQWLDFLMITAATALVLVAELFNSAIEAVCDFMEPNKNEKIGAIKDIAAAAVAVIMAVWLIVVISDVFNIVTALSQRWRG